MNRNKFSVIFLLSLVIVLQNLDAQVINIEKKRKNDSTGFAGAVSLGFYFIDNGKRISNLKNVIDLQYVFGSNTFLVLNDLDLMRVDNENLVNGGFQHFRYNYTVKDSSFLTLEAFIQHQYNPIKLLKRRLLGGLGPRFRITGKEKVQLFLGTLAMYEMEELSDSMATSNNFVRLGSYLSFKWNILSNLRFYNITYYQPAFSNFDDYRLAMESYFEFKITNALSLKTGIQANYDSKPPEKIQKLFYNWDNELIYRF